MFSEKILNYLITSLIFFTFTLRYLTRTLEVIPRGVSWLPDILAILLFILVLTVMAINKKMDLSKSYIILFMCYVVHILIGIVANAVPAGAVIAGFRSYFRWVPFFFLASVIPIKRGTIRWQIALLFGFGIVQVVVAVYQRFIKFSELKTGDVVIGTLGGAPFLVMFQIALICLLLALYVQGKWRFLLCFFLSMFLFIPCLINETKAVIILLPAAIMTILIFSKSNKSRAKQYVIIPLVLIILLSIFIPTYNSLMRQPEYLLPGESGRLTIIDLFTGTRVKRYLYKKASGEGAGEEIGRVDSLILAMRNISQDPIRLIYGFGAGNVNESFVGLLKGNQTHFSGYGANVTTFSIFLWELGLIGIFFPLIFLFLNFVDAFSLQNATDICGGLSLAWLGIVAMMTISLVYVNLMNSALDLLFWYLAGYIAAENHRSRLSMASMTYRGLPMSSTSKEASI